MLSLTYQRVSLQRETFANVDMSNSALFTMEDRLSPHIIVWIASDASTSSTADLPSGEQLRQAESDPAAIFQFYLIVQPNPEKPDFQFLTVVKTCYVVQN